MKKPKRPQTILYYNTYPLNNILEFELKDVDGNNYKQNLYDNEVVNVLRCGKLIEIFAKNIKVNDRLLCKDVNYSNDLVIKTPELKGIKWLLSMLRDMFMI